MSDVNAALRAAATALADTLAGLPLRAVDRGGARLHEAVLAQLGKNPAAPDAAPDDADALVLAFPSEETVPEPAAFVKTERVLLVAPRRDGPGGASAALLAFAEAGLVPEAGPGRVVETADGDGLVVHRLTRRAFAIRLARADDLSALLRLERACWPAGLRSTRATLAGRIEHHPQGQHVLTRDGTVVGAVFSQRIEAAAFDGMSFREVHRLHAPAGPLVQLLALNVDPREQDRGYGDPLIEFALQRAAASPDVAGVVGITRCKDAGKRPDLAPAAYAELRDGRGRRRDPVLRFHERHGAEIVRLVEGYRPPDAVNGGAGVLVRYDLARRRLDAAPTEAVAALPAETGATVRALVAEVLGREGGEPVPMGVPLFELGLDSGDLLRLNEAIRARFGLALEPAFFFEHNTCARIITHLEATRPAGPAPAPAAPAAAPHPAEGVRAEDIAIVGIACRLPGATDPEAFWQLLSEGRSAVGTRPEGRWTWPEGFDPAAHPGIERGGFLDDVARFDATFFRISPREAAGMDPQHRLVLEASWAVLEDAGWAPSALAGSDTGVFVGASGSDYHLRLCETPLAGIDGHFGLGASMAVLANRLSYFYDLSGPSLQLDTACSSSLVALHEAVRALRRGDCGRALVGGVNLLCHPGNAIAFHRAGMLSREGRCKTFDRAADGYVRGEGVVLLALRPLSDALRDGDRVQAVIKGTATNHGGLAAGLTTPNPAKQAALVTAALADAGVEAAGLSYVEAHGTGTALGDPVELRGLKRAFEGVAGEGGCALGSVKTNIGHLEAAAGLAGLLKVVLALRERTIPASLHFEEVNPHLSLDGSPFRVATERAPWRAAYPRRAGISSFGSGGSNAHAILEEAPALPARPAPAGPAAAPLSARTPEDLAARAAALAAHLDAPGFDAAAMHDAAHTLRTGREALPVRATIVADEPAAFLAALRALAAGGDAPGLHRGETVAAPTPEPGRPLRRIALPTYPFGGEPHWLPDTAPPQRAGAPAAADDLFGRVRALVAEVLGLSPETIDPREPLREHGLDSIGGQRLQQLVESGLGLRISGADLLDHADLAGLVDHLAGLMPAAQTVAATPRAAPAARRASEGQAALHALQAANPDLAAYNLPFALRFSGRIDAQRLAAALDAVLARHPVLGERLVMDEDGLRRMPGAGPDIRHGSLAGLDPADRLARLRRLAAVPFALDREAPLRVHLLSEGEADTLLLVVHHVAFDGGSVRPFLTSLLDAYLDKSAAGPEAADYDAFVAWEAEEVAGPAGERARAHFARRLAGAPPVLGLPLDRPRKAARRRGGACVSLAIEGEESARVRAFCRAAGTGAAGLFLTSYATALSRHAGEADLVIGVAASLRAQPRFAALVGFLVNMVPVRLRLDEAVSWREAVRHVQRVLAGDLDHAAYPFGRLVRALETPREAGLSPLYQAAFNHRGTEGDEAALARAYADALPFAFEPGLRQEGAHDLELETSETGDGFALHLKYDPDLFEPASAERLAGHVLALVRAALARPDAPLAEAAMLSAGEVAALAAWNATATDHGEDLTLDACVARVAARNPEATAFTFGEASMSFAAFEARAERLARRLAARGAGPGTLVGVCAGRSLDLPVALLAVLKTGAAYVPLDPDLPRDRLAGIVADSRPRLVLGDAQAPAWLDALAIEAEEAPSARPEVPADPGRLAYVMYTSGSTGAPKGVAIGHRAFRNALLGLSARPGLSASDRLFALTTFAFDISGFELFAPAILGAECAICPAEVVRDADRLAAAFTTLRPTIAQATPSVWRMLFDAGWQPAPGLKILCGGEPLPEGLRARFVAAGAEAWNLYGPTEATIWATAQRIAADAPRGVGTPLANARIHVLDGRMRPCPVGVSGEVCIAGTGLAEGYLNRPELTAERFVASPVEDGGRIYRTGDIGRWLPDGSLDLLGRGDGQIKLRGYRIELGDIEANLVAHPAIREAVVAVEEAGERRSLAAFVLPADEAVPDEAELRRHLAARLPGYMVPARFAAVAAFPVTANGKVDRAALLAAPKEAGGTGESAPARPAGDVAELELRIGQIWRAVLARPEIGRDDGFFDVGGDSLLAVTLARRIAAATGRPFDVTALFRHTTIAAIAAHLSEAGVAPGPARAPAPLPRREAEGRDEPGLAIIGISCRFPGAADLDAFWDNLLAGRSGVRHPDRETLARAGIAAEALSDPRFVAADATIDGKALFDPAFFRIAPRDAERMHPQLRLLLMHAWRAVEDAGYAHADVSDAAVVMSASATAYGPASSGPESPDGPRILTEFGPYQDWLLAQGGTIPTMVSHRLGLTGPSYLVHANCSSSLVALSHAFETITRGDARHALVGAASLLPQWSAGYRHQEGLNFSRDGRIKAFDAAADGMVGGEGVAVLLVKRAADAIADGDRIYALVRGVGLNNDGADKAGFYAPGQRGQAAVIDGALRRAGIGPGAVAFVEAHGTGTALGDPVEVGALTEVYRRGTDAVGTCGIGSVKSNIGHLDVAAGLAGVIKTALALRDGVVPPTANYRRPNPKLDLAASPFFVIDAPLTLPKTGPVHAAVSSFGIGGTNAHAILARAPERPLPHAAPEGETHLVLLSARDGARLREAAANLVGAVEDASAPRLADIAYTLQVGRTAMEARLAILARTGVELADALRRWLDGATAEGVFHGAGGTAPAAFLRDAGVAAAVAGWLRDGRLALLAEYWTHGHAVDWTRLARSGPVRRERLPTYPFARESYWSAGAIAADARAATGRLHPLVHENVSDLDGQRFRARLSARDWVLADHVVDGVPILPGVAQIEMARVAAERSFADPDAALHLHDVIWLRPLACPGEAVEVVIDVEPRDDGGLDWSIRSAETEGEEPVVFSRGRATAATAGAPPVLDLPALREGAQRTMAGEAAYARFVDLGFGYGPGFRGIARLASGRDGTGGVYVLADIARPLDAADYGLHPGVLDAALQSRLGFETEGSEAVASLPFAIDAVVLHGPTPERGVVWARPAPGEAGRPLPRLDIDVADDAGRVAVSLRGFASRPAGAAKAEDRPEAAPNAGLVLGRRIWREAPITVSAQGWDDHLVVLCAPVELAAEIERDFAAALPAARLAVLAHDPFDGDAERFRAAAAELLIEIRSAVAADAKGRTLIQLALCGEEGALLEGLSGLLACAVLEEPRLCARVSRFADTGPAAILAGIAADAADASERTRRDGAGLRTVPTWEPVAATEAASPWRDRGVYLITGGFGGLGLLFAEEIARTTSGTTLVLAGRSGADAASEARLAAIEASGARVLRRSLDVTDAAAVAETVAGIVAACGPLTGILHAAGTLRDGLAVRAALGDLDAVLAPKVAGAVNLDAATAGMPLELFVLFASVSGALGAVGQTGYGAANAFLDAFAEERARLVRDGQRRGRTLSLAWPLWRAGGMSVDAGTEAALARRGRTPLATADGFAALRTALACEAETVLVLAGDVGRLRREFFGAQTEPAVAEMPVPAAVQPEPARPPVAAGSADGLRGRAVDFLKRRLAAVAKLPVARIETEADLDAYGIDSVMAVALVTDFEEALGPLSKTLLFERRSVGDLADYVLAERRAELERHLGGPTRTAAPTIPAPARPAPSPTGARRGSAPARRFRRGEAARAPAASGPLDVAIIGLAGRYPKARDVDAFWDNLRSGRDCIEEIPFERWDHARYYDPDRTRPDTTHSKWGGFIDGVAECDPLFFNIAPSEMEAIDPQERLFLQCVYEAVEDAGYTRESLASVRGVPADVGVYVGVMYAEYQLYGAQAQVRGVPLTLTGSPASIANRVSYFFNFGGPSIAVDTMCSSSLTAIHLACRDLRHGCEYAVAGGVNVSVHPNKYLFLGQNGFVSSEGRCASFGKGGDGYVPGEGVGAVLLKPLDRAVADGDRIYGVIRSTAVNHGGKTNGYTVPNPLAQGRVVERALREAGIDPRALSYVEAHGTGTSLGDPIEIAGLTRAFSGFTSDRGFCAIGSAKSNIGHCESAAGIAGLTKVLLQMRHGEIAPSLHADTLNPHIDFDASPFRVQTQLAPWTRPVLRQDGVEREQPRLAGISSFGAGGANAHIVIEEYRPPERTADAAVVPVVLPLSARTPEQLRARAQDLAAALDAGAVAAGELSDLAFTLQLGREAHDHRLAILADSLATARARLGDWLAGTEDLPDLWTGQGRRDGTLSLLGEDDLAAVTERWIARGELGRLAEAWTRGARIAWGSLHEGPRRRLRLPTYPFARDRLWPAHAHDGLAAGGAWLHPLLHENVSDLFGQRFRTRLSPDDALLRDHVVNGARVLPGVAQLEMARAAVAVAAAAGTHGVRLIDAAWLRPLAVEAGGCTIVVEVRADEDGLSWAIRPDAEDAPAFSQGRAEIVAASARPALDLDALRARCDRSVPVEAFYDRAAARGLAYGPSLRGLAALSVGPAEALAEIATPRQPGEGVLLDPAFADAALQATMALGPDDADKAPLPFAVREVVLYGALPERGFAWVRRADDPSGAAVSFDIDILDGAGGLRARLAGLVGRRPERGVESPAAVAATVGTVVLTPAWETAPDRGPAPDPVSGPLAILGRGPDAEAALRLLPEAVRLDIGPGSSAEAIARALEAAPAFTRLLWIPGEASPSAALPAPDALVDAQESGVVLGFRLAKALIETGRAGRPLDWTVVTRQALPTTDEPVDPTHAAIHGFMGSLAKEQGPHWRVRLVDAQADGPLPIADILEREPPASGEPLAWRHGRWLSRVLLPSRFAVPARSPYRDGGLYVVAGGAGGIGEVWTEHVLRRNRAQVVWLGRRPEDAAIRDRIARLSEFGPAPVYLQADATDAAALATARSRIRDRFGAVTGLVHSALVLKDRSLVRMDEATFREVLAAKVDAGVRLAAAFAGEPLELFLSFSSMTSFATPPGQSNYAAGCVFADAYAHALRRAADVPAKVVNWGWWGSVGAVATEAHRTRMTRLGFDSVEPEEGMAALDALLLGPADQIAFLKTGRPLTRQDGVADEALLALEPTSSSVLSQIMIDGGSFDA